MNETSRALKDLHCLLQEIQSIRDQIARGPKRIQIMKKRRAEQEQQLQEQQSHILTVKKGIDEKNLQMNTYEAELKKLQVQLNQSTSNREFEVLKEQIDADTMAQSVLEDEILEALEKVDRLEEGVKEAQQACLDAKQKEEQVANQVQAEKPELQSKLSTLELQRTEAEQIIPGTIKADYRRLVKIHLDQALMPVQGKACTNCYVQMSAQQMVELRAGKVFLCRTCGRVLYLDATDN